MGVGTHAEQLEAMIAQPDFLEVYADKELTVFGITGKLQDLAGMCPVNLSDPRVTLEAKNEFVIKVANESGMEIAPEHESYFSQVVEKHGQERKFTVAIADQSHASERQTDRRRPETSSRTDAPKDHASHSDQLDRRAPSVAHRHRQAEPRTQQDGTGARQVARETDPARLDVAPMDVGSVALGAKQYADAAWRNVSSTL